MKRAILILFCLLLVLNLSACKEKIDNVVFEPDIVGVRDICKLATIECYYHNVAKLKKPGESKLLGITKSSTRQLWIEYTGVVKIGIDFSKVRMEMDGYDVLVYMPEAEYIDMHILEDTLTPNSFYISEDDSPLWFENKITAEDQRKAIEDAQEKMREEVMANKTLLLNAEQRAQELIENYISNLGEACGITYNIIFKEI